MENDPNSAADEKEDLIVPETPAEAHRQLTEEEQLELVMKLAELSTPILQDMANAADKGEVNDYFAAYSRLMQTWTPQELKDKGIIVPPWYIPRNDIDRIVVHTQLALLTKAMVDSGVFRAAAAAHKAKKGVGLTDANGRPL